MAPHAVPERDEQNGIEGRPVEGVPTARPAAPRRPSIPGRLIEQACERLSRQGVNFGMLEVSVRDGHMTLRGIATDQNAKSRVEQAVAAVLGVVVAEQQDHAAGSARSPDAVGELRIDHDPEREPQP